jgi:formyltetrahydrofolate deformylase
VAAELVLTLSCPDRPGIVHAVSGFLAERGGNILDSQQYGSPISRRFFLRMHVDSPLDRAAMADEFGPVAQRFAMTWDLHDSADSPGVVVMVSRQGHCLNDLLYRWRSGHLPGEPRAVVSNHRELEPLAASYGIPFTHLPITPETREAREADLLAIVDEVSAELLVMARYMQVLSPALCQTMVGRIINIHHSFLPSFAGGRPYDQAFTRGVKLIGATAHYATPDLDDGPIIEQEVARVTHQHSPADLAGVGRDLECVALARAVRWHLERRVLLDGSRTVVFP